MRKEVLFNDDWTFEKPGHQPQKLNLPHTWNGEDGQDGGNDYLRTTCTYHKKFSMPSISEGEKCVLRFHGVNSECSIILNGQAVGKHEGGYSLFNVDITAFLQEENDLVVKVSNEKNRKVYPQRADFTFYGGIYRDVYLITLPKVCFDYGPEYSDPLKLVTTVKDGAGHITVMGYTQAKKSKVTVYEGEKVVATGILGQEIIIPDVILWHGLKNPFLYTVTAEIIENGKVIDKVTQRAGFRTFKVDPDKGFFLNGEHYPLRGVCRHQDRPKVGNAISKADHDEDMDLILEIGATTVRLAHYQHDQYFYDLCDEKGLIVWAEIPYISEHMIGADDNIYSQMRELIQQNINHPSIICWGISNEIMIKRQNPQPIVACHKKCQELCHELDPSRLTAVACYSVTGNGHPTAHISDLTSWNLYFGWYFPGTFLLGWKLDAFHKKYKTQPIGLSEYGAEAMINLHSVRPRRLDNTEDYQCIYHEKTMEVIMPRDYIWATHIWNMFDFGSDGRNQGGEPGMNHKGLVTFDRKIKKDSFYLYKALWSKEKFVHICGKRFVNRTGKKLNIKVYSNCGEVKLYQNGRHVATKVADKLNSVFNFTLDMEAENVIVAESGKLRDDAVFNKVAKPDAAYRLSKEKKGNNMSWEK